MPRAAIFRHAETRSDPHCVNGRAHRLITCASEATRKLKIG
jgi:hypothetical protein